MLWPWAMMQGNAAPETPAAPAAKTGKDRKEGK